VRDLPDTGTQVVVGRQPIFDATLRTVGYELLFRGARDPETPDLWTASLIVDAVSEIGLDRLVGGRPAWVNVTREFLLAVDPLPFAPEQVVLELTEDSHAPDPALLARLDALRADGWTIALDDFVFDASLAPLIERAAIVKLDVLAHAGGALEGQLAALAPFGLELLAEKVETHEQFERCLALGFERFQGYFFARPRLLSGPGLPAQQLTTVRSLAELSAPGIGFEGLEAAISRDVGLTYKLLRYVNSAFFALPRRVGSVREALVLLGERSVRQWALVMALAGTQEGPRELLSLALVRARLCQAQAVGLGAGGSDDTFFLAGLLSVIDALLDAPMNAVVERLPLNDAIVEALLHGDGVAGEALARVLAFERGEVDALEGALDPAAVVPALAWADAATRATAAPAEPATSER